jgi:hypothetical protein
MKNTPCSTIYADEARCIDKAMKQLNQQIEEFERKTNLNEMIAEDTYAEIEEFETKAEKAAKNFNKLVEKHRKSQLKEQHELREQELKTIQLAEKLAKRQDHMRQIELQQAKEAIDNEVEARRLVQNLIREREEECKLVEERMNDLLRAEKEASIFLLYLSDLYF